MRVRVRGKADEYPYKCTTLSLSSQIAFMLRDLQIYLDHYELLPQHFMDWTLAKQPAPALG